MFPAYSIQLSIGSCLIKTGGTTEGTTGTAGFAVVAMVAVVTTGATTVLALAAVARAVMALVRVGDVTALVRPFIVTEREHSKTSTQSMS